LAVKSGCKLHQEFTALKVRAHPLGHSRHQALGTNGGCKLTLPSRLGSVSSAIKRSPGRECQKPCGAM